MINSEEIDTDYILALIGTAIKRYRKIRGYTVVKLSKKSGVSVGVISDLTTMRGRVPSLTNFIKIAAALEMPNDIIMGILTSSKSLKKTQSNILREALLTHGVSKENIPMTVSLIDIVIKNLQN